MRAVIGIVCTSVFCLKDIYTDDIDVDLSENVRFFLYTRTGGEVPQQLYVDDEESITSSNYNVSAFTKFYTHGLNRSYLDDDSVLVRKGFLKNDNFNFIVVDWGNIAKNQSYENVLGYTKTIGSYIADMIDFLVSLGSDSLDMSLVGHSLGAQFIGSAGYSATNQVGHIVGLDPATEGFNMTESEGRISTESAVLVEIIHTSGNSTTEGHLDFYPNGGEIQLGCDDDDCSSDRAHIYYAEALNTPKNWFGVQWGNYDEFLRQDYNNTSRLIMSFPLWIAGLKKTAGTYYLRTAASEPYGLGFAGLKP